MQNNKNRLIQLIPGNPGTSFVVCLIYALNQKYNLGIPNKDQISIFKSGIVKSRYIFHTGILSIIAQKYKHNISVFTSSSLVKKYSSQEVKKNLVTYSLLELNPINIRKLLDKFHYVTLSVDFYFFYPYYHDYHFCCLGKNTNGYTVFEPKESQIKKIDDEQLKDLILSTKKGLGDEILAFCC